MHELYVSLRMKAIIHPFVAITMSLVMVYANDKMLPPEDLRADWEELEKINFADWSIKVFHGWDVPFDGGSKVFFFESDAGERFDLMVANPAYWTEEDKRLRRQVFIVIHKNRFYRVEPASEQEKNLIEKLTKAEGQITGEAKRDPKLLKTLAERLTSRKPIFKTRG